MVLGADVSVFNAVLSASGVNVNVHLSGNRRGSIDRQYGYETRWNTLPFLRM